MLLYLVLWLICISRVSDVNAFLLHQSYNIKIEDSADYKIDEFIEEKDYEMINDNDIKQFRIDDKENKLYELKKLARKEYKKKLETIGPKKEWFRGTEPTAAVVTDALALIFTTYQTLSKQHALKKRENIYKDYEYGYLIKEYYDESMDEVKSNHTYHAIIQNDTVISSVNKIWKFDTKTRNCTEEEIKHIGFKAINCIYQDYRKHKEQPLVLAKRLWRILKIWFLLYIIVATPLWCTRGWCCWCLICKFCQPRSTIENAKRYLIKNPPGVLTSKKAGETHYEPTEYEIKSYEELEHLIRTI